MNVSCDIPMNIPRECKDFKQQLFLKQSHHDMHEASKSAELE